MLRSTLGEPVARTSTGDQFGPSNYGRAQGNKRNTVIRNDAQQKIDETLTCRAHPLPIFIISYNRGDTLSRVVDSYRKQARPVEIIIHDNGSNDLATLAVLDEFAGSGVKVYRRPPINLKDELNLINETVADYFRVWGEPSRYVVTDCDIDLSIASPDALALYDELLDRFRTVACVGPMLRISDIRQTYALFNHVMNRHIDRFWRKEPTLAQTSLGQIAFVEAPIDTTFALHRAGEPFQRLKQGLRVYFPYEARHLEWYHDADKLNHYHETSSSNISHWNNKSYYELKRKEELLFPEYKIVEKDIDGRLIVSLKNPAVDNPA
jgi:glycosyltransferase involved in cell wall biosynthesis